ncbi:helix-turn-helix domain-containing protein [Candidatus Uhrbacteria bacterium]|nr:helix-turn-helix domain-containing protein [Candidatus Uhrbacteria bacterium]
MTELESQLMTVGLSSTEARLYLAGLAHTGVGVHQLAKETAIKRPTVYHALETLIQKGLVSKSGTGARRLFHMSHPEHVKQLLDQKITQLQEHKKGIDVLLPLLLQRVSHPQGQAMEVMQYEGIEGIKMVVEEALYCKSRHWDIMAPRKNFFSEFDKAYAHYYVSSRKQRKITSRSLWEKTIGQKNDSSTQKPPLETLKERNPRFLPQVMQGKFTSVMILFDDKVAFISSYETLSAVLIHSKEIHQFMANMFEGIWSISEPV